MHQPGVQDHVSRREGSAHDDRDGNPDWCDNHHNHRLVVVVNCHVVGVASDEPDVIVVIIVVVVIIIVVDVGIKIRYSVEPHQHGGHHVVGVEAVLAVAARAIRPPGTVSCWPNWPVSGQSRYLGP
jgi:hypothetical protein